MTQTRFEGPVASGDVPNTYSIGTTNYTANIGLAVLSQSATLSASSATTVTGTLYVPQQSQLLGVLVNTQTAWADGGALTVGTPTTSTAYLASMNVTSVVATANFALTTAAINVGTTQAVVFTVTATAAVATGMSIVTLQYVQTTSTYS